MIKHRNPPGTLLCIDYGLKRIGLAISDEDRRLAVGAGWLEDISGRSLARAIKKEADKRGIREIVVGEPPEGSREVGEVIKGADRLTGALKKMGFEVVRWDESFSTATALADRKKYGGKSSKPRGWIDEAAAILILQSYIESNPP